MCAIQCVNHYILMCYLSAFAVPCDSNSLANPFPHAFSNCSTADAVDTFFNTWRLCSKGEVCQQKELIEVFQTQNDDKWWSNPIHAKDVLRGVWCFTWFYQSTSSPQISIPQDSPHEVFDASPKKSSWCMKIQAIATLFSIQWFRRFSLSQWDTGHGAPFSSVSWFKKKPFTIRSFYRSSPIRMKHHNGLV